MWTMALDKLLRHLIRTGEMTVQYPDGQTRRYGEADNGAKVSIALNDPSLPRKIALSPDMAVGEAYMDGRLTIKDDDLYGFLGLAISNIAAQGQPWFRRPLEAGRHLLRHLQQFNPVHRARANVAHHYDLSGELYDLFLDEDRQYSCAYFRDPDMSLEQAQAAKKHHIARKLRIEPGMRVLDIGCGWGGMGLTLARDYGAEVMGVTLSREQHAMANARADAAGLANKAQFRLMDYRDVTGQFDRIVSVGMFEHVGVPHYREYFDAVRTLLPESGIALIHTIGRARPPGSTSPWITKYIFPGGYCPSLSEASAAVERADLIATDIEIWRLHYAETLRHWHDRFMANIDQARALYDERFCRMWRYYLVASELTFRLNRQVVFQMQLTRAQDAVPLTRDYLYTSDDEAARHAAQ
ncbi:class I SAM-dependent methyltransferase [Roseovarius sp. 2305UL8-3]|uniref:class I SAM-dependent methyltransferase n=1 Tax=Roseovarius conchicola TaxID=3121636 RepID=UPI003527CD02